MRGGRAGAGDGDLVDVELVDDDGGSTAGSPRAATEVADPPDGDAPGASDGARPARRRPVLRRGAWVAVAGVLALVLGVNVVEARRTAAEDAALSALPGVVGSLADPVVRVWESGAAHPVAVLGQVVVVEAMEPTSMLQALDAGSGEQLWTLATELGQERYRYCSPWWDWGRGTESAATSLACIVYDHGATTQGGAGPAVVELVEIPTGDLVGTFELEGQPLSYWRRGDDLVTAWVDGTRRVVAVRLRTDGTEVWRTTSDPVPPELDLTQLATGADEEVLRAEFQDWSLETTPEVVMEVDLNTGEPGTDPGADRSPTWTDTVELPSGHRATTRYSRDSATPASTVVEGPDGAQVLEVEGWLQTSAVDDGSAAEVVLVSDPDGPLVARDLGSGEELWTRDGAAYHQAVLRLRGVVVLVAGGEAVAVDLRTGAELWTVADVADVGGVTDGRRVLLGRQEDGGGLSAHDLRDGSELWRISLPGLEQLMDGPEVVLLRRGGALEGYR